MFLLYSTQSQRYDFFQRDNRNQILIKTISTTTTVILLPITLNITLINSFVFNPLCVKIGMGGYKSLRKLIVLLMLSQLAFGMVEFSNEEGNLLCV